MPYATAIGVKELFGAAVISIGNGKWQRSCEASVTGQLPLLDRDRNFLGDLL